MKSLDNIRQHLQDAADAHKSDKPFSRDDSLLDAFAELEAERLKFRFWGGYTLSGAYNLGEAGEQLSTFTKYLNDLIFQFSYNHGCIDTEKWDETINIRLDALEHYIIKILAIAQILKATENRDTSIKICGVSSVKELGEAAQ